jgi:putative ABC transport system substrate-binding protein
MINRRAFVAGLGAVLAVPFASEAQQTPKLPRVGYASVNTLTVTVQAFEQGLRQLGYVLGQNVVLDYRFA